MILYFDNLITNNPAVKGLYGELAKVRAGCEAYKMPDKVDITLYTLASYAEYKNWSYVLIKYEMQDKTRRKEFESSVKKIFPKAEIVYGRSDNQEKFKRSLEIIESKNDEWIFYAGNTDHPIIAPSLEIIDKCLEKAKNERRKNKFVSIVYSHFTESLQMARKGTPVHELAYRDSRILGEDDNTITAVFPNGYYASIQIVHKDLLRHWISSANYEGKTIWRAEDMGKYVKTKNQVMVLPKKIICEHFDGYSHTKKIGFEIPSNIVPPLFLPMGFFEKKMNIAYGYKKYRAGWVNINPLTKNYSFESKNGTDLMISLDSIPLFWKKRIKKIDINPEIDEKQLEAIARMKFESYKDPFKKRSVVYYRIVDIKRKIKNKLSQPTFLPQKVYYSLRKIKILRKIRNDVVGVLD